VSTDLLELTLLKVRFAASNLDTVITVEHSLNRFSVRSLTLDKLDAELVLFMKALGNEKVNKILEHSVGSEHTKPTAETERFAS